MKSPTLADTQGPHRDASDESRFHQGHLFRSEPLKYRVWQRKGLLIFQRSPIRSLPPDSVHSWFFFFEMILMGLPSNSPAPLAKCSTNQSSGPPYMSSYSMQCLQSRSTPFPTPAGSVVQNFPSRGAPQSRERETLSLADQFPAAPFVFSKLLWSSKLPFGFPNLRSTCNISV